MESEKKILFFHQGALGDFILVLPVLESIHASFPGAIFTFIGNAQVLSLIEKRPFVGKIISKDLSILAPLFSRPLKNRDTLSSFLGCPYDAAFLFGKSALLHLAKNVREMPVEKIYTVESFPGEKTNLPVTDYIYKQLNAQDLYLKPRKPVIAPAIEEKKKGVRYAEELLRNFEKLLLLHPGSGSMKKIWPIACWNALLESLHTHTNVAKVILTGEADTLLLKKLSPVSGEPDFRIIRKWPLAKIAGLLTKGSLFIGNDSGITHLAAALSIDTVAIFGLSNPRVWAPRGEKVTIFHTTWNFPENLHDYPKITPDKLPKELLDHVVSSLGI